MMYRSRQSVPFKSSKQKGCIHIVCWQSQVKKVFYYRKGLCCSNTLSSMAEPTEMQEVQTRQMLQMHSTQYHKKLIRRSYHCARQIPIRESSFPSSLIGLKSCLPWGRREYIDPLVLTFFPPLFPSITSQMFCIPASHNSNI